MNSLPLAAQGFHARLAAKSNHTVILQTLTAAMVTIQTPTKGMVENMDRLHFRSSTVSSRALGLVLVQDQALETLQSKCNTLAGLIIYFPLPPRSLCHSAGVFAVSIIRILG